MKALGRYVISEELGSGGFGVVYRGRDPELEREVAIKLMSLQNAADPKLVARFRKEARAAARLSHPSIIQVYDVGDEGDRPFIVMELLEGTDLSEILSKGITMPFADRLSILIQSAEALQHAHEQGIVHRDIKPGNIRVLGDGTLRLLDFGIAKVLDGDQTQTRSIVGTVGYMPPEQLKGETVDARSDLFSLGVVGYELLSGRRAFPGKTVTEVIVRIVKEQPAPLREVRGNGWDWVEAVVMRAMDKSPEHRFASCSAFAEELRAGLAAAVGAKEATVTAAIGGSAEPPAPSPPREATSPAADVLAEADALVPETTTLPAAALSSTRAIVDAERASQQPPASSPPRVAGDRSRSVRLALLVAGAVLAVVVVASVWPRRGSSTDSSVADAEPSPRVASSPSLAPPKTPAETSDPLSIRLAEARELFDKKQLTRPPGGCALDIYLQVRQQHPDNADAAAGIREISAFFLASGDSRANSGQVGEARRSYVTAGNVLASLEHGRTTDLPSGPGDDAAFYGAVEELDGARLTSYLTRYPDGQHKQRAGLLLDGLRNPKPTSSGADAEQPASTAPTSLVFFADTAGGRWSTEVEVVEDGGFRFRVRHLHGGFRKVFGGGACDGQLVVSRSGVAFVPGDGGDPAHGFSYPSAQLELRTGGRDGRKLELELIDGDKNWDLSVVFGRANEASTLADLGARSRIHEFVLLAATDVDGARDRIEQFTGVAP